MYQMSLKMHVQDQNLPAACGVHKPTANAIFRDIPWLQEGSRHPMV